MDPERARTLLTEELAQLDAEAPADAPAPGDDRSAEGLDFGDAASRTTETMDHDLAAGTRDVHRERVRAALARLDRGEYGICAVCGAVIDDERLEARPETDRCRRHPERDREVPHPVEG